MKNKSILICLERLDVGGVETSVYNQSLVFKKKGYDVVVLAKQGIYNEKLQSKGIICIDFEFDLANEINSDKTKRIIEIIKQYNVGQVHIHQLPCVLNVLTACLITNTPYIAFVHSRLTEVYDWYINNFSIYKRLLKFYFENAYKIITLNHASIELNAKYFNIDKEKYKVLKNSIVFDEYVSNTEVTSVKKFMIISRIAPEKIIPIQNGIKCFIEYANTFEQFDGQLAIYGDGNEENIEKIKKYIEENNSNNYNISLAGSTNEVAKEMEKYDVVIAMGRCIIEAMATKRLAIVTSPDELKFLIDSTNIYDAIEGNFASNDLKAQKLEDIIEQLKNLNTEQIKKITKENYQIALNELNMFTNAYCIEETDINDKYEIQLIELMNIQLEDLKSQRDKNTTEESADVIEQQKKIIEEQKNVIENKEQRNTELFNELSSVYNSKRFKVVNKIANMITRKK